MNANFDESYTFSKYSKDTKLISNCTTVSLIIIFIFVITPLNSFKPLCTICKILAFLILAFALYYNLHSSYKLSKTNNINYLDGTWNSLKNNMICSYVYSFFIFILIVTVIKSVFQ